MPDDLGNVNSNAKCAAAKVAVIYAAVANYAADVKDSQQEDLERLQFIIGLSFAAVKTAVIAGGAAAGGAGVIAGAAIGDCVDSAGQVVNYAVGKNKRLQPLDIDKNIYKILYTETLLPAHPGIQVPGLADKNMAGATDLIEEQEQKMRKDKGDEFVKNARHFYSAMTGQSLTAF